MKNTFVSTITAIVTGLALVWLVWAFSQDYHSPARAGDRVIVLSHSGVIDEAIVLDISSNHSFIKVRSTTGREFWTPNDGAITVLAKQAGQ